MNHKRSIFLDKHSPPHIGTLIFVSAMSAMAMNMYLPALPEMAQEFETSYSMVQLSVGLFLVTSAFMQLVLGPLSDRYGRRSTMLVSFVVFALSSYAAAATSSIVIFCILRMMQAVSVAGMLLSRAIIRDLYDTDRGASQIGYVTMGMALAPMIAPGIGGILAAAFGWRAIFWALCTAGIIASLLVWKDLGETNTHRSRDLDSQFRKYPELLESRRFWGYAISTALSSGVFFSYLGGAPFVGSEVFLLDARDLGLWLGAPAVGYMVGNGLSGRYSSRIGINPMIIIGASIVCAGMSVSLIIFLSGHGSVASFFGLMITVGLGNGLVIPNAMAGMMSVRPHLAGSASGLGGALMVGGGAALSALAAALLGPDSGATPLLWLMLSCAALGLVSAIYTSNRARLADIAAK